MLKANYHTHHFLCGHADGNVEDYVKKAIEYGYQEIGISDHGPIAYEINLAGETKWLHMTLQEFETIYLPEIQAVKEKYKNQIRVLSSIEIEYLPEYHHYLEYLKSRVDYLNLSVHYFRYRGKIEHVHCHTDYQSIYAYLQNALVAMDSGLYQIFVHPDIFYLRYTSESGESEFDFHCEHVTRKIIEKAIEKNIYLEINCTGILKTMKEQKVIGEWGYPCDMFWNIVKEYKDVKVVIGVDAHTPKHLNDKAISDAITFAKKHEITLCDYIELGK